jgi:hypothetical protein
VPDVYVLVSGEVRSLSRNQATGESRAICTLLPLKRAQGYLVNWLAEQHRSFSLRGQPFGRNRPGFSVIGNLMIVYEQLIS